jgi:hypothetical protein
VCAVYDSAEGKYYVMCIHTQIILLWGHILERVLLAPIDLSFAVIGTILSV